VVERDPFAQDSEVRSAIRQRAYEIYLSRRGRNGDPLSDWLQAEREFDHRRQSELRNREARTRGGSELAGAEPEC
jgi:hypothetical protein